MSWQTDPVGVKQIDWIKRILNTNVVGPQLTEQATAFLAQYEQDPENTTKGDASELLDKLFKTPRKGDDLPAGIYRQGEHVFIIRPNKKYIEDPKQKGAGHYAMALVPAPHAATTRYELVFDPEAKGSLAKGDLTTLDGIADVLPMCGTKAKKTLQSLAA
jgi:hypothetical protein